NGKFLIAGGVDTAGNPLTSAEIFDPGTGAGDQGTFTATGALPTARAGHVAVTVPVGAYAGQVILFGGYQGNMSAPTPFSTVIAFDRTIGMFLSIPTAMAGPRYGLTATVLTGGTQMLVVGGNDLNAPEIFDPYANGLGSGIATDAGFSRTQDGSGTDTAMTGVTQGRSFHTETWLANGTILLCGGDDGGTVTGSAELFNP
ncbi:MAG: Kelch repeat-containing protein, partial [Planctomycetota bacterium]